MPRHTLIELIHIAAGIAATVAVTKIAAWAYPLGRETIWWVGAAMVVLVTAMGVGALRRAVGLDHEERKR